MLPSIAAKKKEEDDQACRNYTYAALAVTDIVLLVLAGVSRLWVLMGFLAVLPLLIIYAKHLHVAIVLHGLETRGIKIGYWIVHLLFALMMICFFLEIPKVALVVGLITAIGWIVKSLYLMKES